MAPRVADDVRGLTLIVESLAERVAGLERRLEERGMAALSAPSTPSATPSPAAPAQPPWPATAPAPGSEGNDVNTIGFEELRAMGLSVTQASRLVSARQERGGFQSFDELDGLPGFSNELLTRLKRTLTISA